MMKRSRSSQLVDRPKLTTAKDGFRLYVIHSSAASSSSEVLDHSSVASYSTLPNGEEKYVTEDAIEQGRQLVKNHLDGVIPLRSLYATLKDIWGKKVFEATRHNFENMKARARKGYADLDSRFGTLPKFLFNMGPRPYAEASIHRMDNAKGYSPENCTWASKATQSRVRRNTCYLTYNGQALPLTEWAERLQVSPQILRGRKQRDWSDEETILGRRIQPATSCPTNAPWPPKMAIKIETEFRGIGGKTHAERCAYLLKKALIDYVRITQQQSTYDEYIECLTEEQNSEYNELYELKRTIAGYRDKMIDELLRIDHPELISRCREVGIDRLFKKDNETYFKKSWD